MSQNSDWTQLAGNTAAPNEENDDGDANLYDYESEGGADDWYNDGHEGGSDSEDSLYRDIIVLIFFIACVAIRGIKPLLDK